MSIYADTLAELVERTCRIVHDWTEGTATGGSSATLEDTSRLEENDYWNDKGAEIYIRTGTYAASTRAITDFVQTGGVITFSPVVGGNIVSTDTYSLHSEFERAEVVAMINLAIDMVAENALLWKVDETSIPLVAATYEYSLPTSFMYIFKVTMANDAGTWGDQPPIDPSHYRVMHGATPKLKFLLFPADQKYAGHYYSGLWAEDGGLVAGRYLRVEGLASPDVLAIDASVCPISPAFVAFQAAALLHMSKVRRAGEDPDNHMVQSQLWQKRADIERARIVPIQLPPDSKRVRE